METVQPFIKIKAELMESESTEIIVKCPHCGEYIIIEKINCGIFRHAVNKKTNKQLNPHSTKEECSEVNKFYGCGKPFRILKLDNVKYTTEICEYI